MIGEVKPSLDELAHHGVKGQRWGQHLAAHPSYTSTARSHDLQSRGKGGVRRINKRLHKGQSLDQARANEDVFVHRRNLAIAGATIAAGLLADRGSTSMSGVNSFIASKAEANRQAARVLEKTLAIGSTASKTPFVKAGRHGVFKITTL